jgi:hypothetical protein
MKSSSFKTFAIILCVFEQSLVNIKVDFFNLKVVTKKNLLQQG